MSEVATWQSVRTPSLEVAYEARGDADAPVAILLHGFPYDPRAYDDVVSLLTAQGLRTIVPYLRGYGPTRFLDAATPRSGQQAALGSDLLQLMDALDIDRALLAGYDWGGRAACIVSALWPDRVQGLVTGTGYNIQNIATSDKPARPDLEHRHWYQYYFHSERGRNGLQDNRAELCQLLWRLWSPEWQFDEATFQRTAPSFDNPDFVDVVVQSYRHRYAYADGDPALEHIERLLAATPEIEVPTVCLHGGADGVGPDELSRGHAKHFSGRYERRVLPSIGHNIPQEEPEAFAKAVLDLRQTK